MTGREMLNALNVKLVALETRNRDLEAQLSEVKAIAENARDRVVSLETLNAAPIA